MIVCFIKIKVKFKLLYFLISRGMTKPGLAVWVYMLAMPGAVSLFAALMA